MADPLVIGGAVGVALWLLGRDKKDDGKARPNPESTEVEINHAMENSAVGLGAVTADVEAILAEGENETESEVVFGVTRANFSDSPGEKVCASAAGENIDCSESRQLSEKRLHEATDGGMLSELRY